MEAVATSRSFADVTRHLANAQPHRIALSFEGRETTYADLERHTNQVANALLAAGVKTGDRVAYFGKNSDTYFEVFFGASKMGGATTPINWRLAGPEVAYILQDSRAPILFVGSEFVIPFAKSRANALTSKRSSQSRRARRSGRSSLFGAMPSQTRRRRFRPERTTRCSSSTHQGRPAGRKASC
jgi:acyl-CoA synthetase (AMP-forming)/AMP-acid ligase II